MSFTRARMQKSKGVAEVTATLLIYPLILGTAGMVGNAITAVVGYIHDRRTDQIQAKQYFCDHKIDCQLYHDFAGGHGPVDPHWDAPLTPPTPAQPQVIVSPPALNVPIQNGVSMP